MARVTVLMPVYNAESTIKDTIQSILDQTFQDFKISILNDSSIDRSIEIINSFHSDKIEITHLKTKNVIGGLNSLIDKCTSDYIARLDHDDLMLPNRLEEQVRFMDENQDVVMSGSYVLAFGNYTKLWKRFRANESQLRQNFFWFNSLAHTSSIVRNKTLQEHGIRYNREYAFIDGDNDYPLTEDFKLCYDLSRVGKLSNIPKVLTKYRIHDVQTSIAKRNIQDHVASRVRREGLIDFLNDNGMSLEKIDEKTDKLALIKDIKKLKVAKKDRWHRAMAQFMLIQSYPEFKLWRFFVLLFTTRLILDRNIIEISIKMLEAKLGSIKKPFI